MSPEFVTAWRLVENTGANVFLTGKAGTGKTTFLKTLREKSHKRMVVLAPTGIAAINAGGQTIHSFFQLPTAPFVPGATLQTSGTRRYDRFSRDKLRLIRSLDLIVIDEISMVRADLLDAVDASLRRHRNASLPFGGVQLLIIGDLGQLSPVVKDSERELLASVYDTPYFFSSKALQQAGYEAVELTKVFRQSDDTFVKLLNKVRDNTADSSVLDTLNSRYIPGFNPADSEGYIRLTTHNAKARDINEARLAALPTPAVTFTAKISGNFPDTSFPAEKLLTLKQGARVMFLKNDPDGQFFNGLTGEVTMLTSTHVEVRPDGRDKAITVEPMVWENTRYSLDADSGAITETIDGTFAQLPLRTAWAITIHKSQGLTFDRTIIDASAAFAHGQTYVALSRCRSLEGIVLEHPLSHHSIINDANVAAFVDNVSKNVVSEQRLSQLQHAFLFSLLDRLFGFEQMRRQFNTLRRLVDEYLSRAYPRLADVYARADEALYNDVESVAVRFKAQYQAIISKSDNAGTSPELHQRVNAASRYFHDRLYNYMDLMKQTPTDADNKAGAKKLAEAVNSLADWLFIRRHILNHFITAQFSISECLKAGAEAAVALDPSTSKTRSKAKSAKASATKPRPTAVPPDVDPANHQCYRTLAQWRLETAKSLQIPAFAVLSNRALVSIANARPTSTFELTTLPGIGRVKASRFGKEIIDMLSSLSE